MKLRFRCSDRAAEYAGDLFVLESLYVVQDEHVLVTELQGAPGALVAGGSMLVGAVEDERGVLVGGQILVAAVVRGMVGPQFAEPMTVLPVVACALVAAAQLLSYAYRATLFLTPADYEKARDLAAHFGFPRRVVENRYGPYKPSRTRGAAE